MCGSPLHGLDLPKSKHKTKNGLNVTVREISKKDLENLNEILNQGNVNNFLHINGSSFEETLRYYENYLSERRIGLKYELVAEINKKVVGATIIELGKYKRSHTGKFAIFIHSQYQGLGIGTILMKQIIDFAKKLGLKRIEANNIHSDNKVALNLYKKLGFKIEGLAKKAIRKNGKLIDGYHIGLIL